MNLRFLQWLRSISLHALLSAVFVFSRKGRFTAEGSNFSEELKEGFLSQILRFGRIPNHPQTQRIHTAVMQPIQTLEGRRISRLG